LEQNSYATSYIKTVGTTQTRVADTASGSGNSTVINSSEGVLYAEISALADDGAIRYITLSDGSNSNYIVIRYYNILGKISAFLSNSLGTQGSTSLVLADVTNSIKVAYKWKLNDFSLWVNGIEVEIQSSGSVFSSGTLSQLNFSDGVGSNNFYGKVKSLQVYTTALSDAELTSLTTI
jgi:hypothetical protein